MRVASDGPLDQRRDERPKASEPEVTSLGFRGGSQKMIHVENSIVSFTIGRAIR